MSNLLRLRQNLNLTQEELSEKSGVSVRTIQRIEAGVTPKGYTLKALAKALDIDEIELLDLNDDPNTENYTWIKVINLSSLLFTVIPPLNLLIPLSIIFIKKEKSTITRKIISIQLLWTLLTVILVLIILMLNDWFKIQSKFIILIPIVWVLVNCTLILRNAIQINKSKEPKLFPDFNFF